MIAARSADEAADRVFTLLGGSPWEVSAWARRCRQRDPEWLVSCKLDRHVTGDVRDAALDALRYAGAKVTVVYEFDRSNSSIRATIGSAAVPVVLVQVAVPAMTGRAA